MSNVDCAALAEPLLFGGHEEVLGHLGRERSSRKHLNEHANRAAYREEETTDGTDDCQDDCCGTLTNLAQPSDLLSLIIHNNELDVRLLLFFISGSGNALCVVVLQCPVGLVTIAIVC